MARRPVCLELSGRKEVVGEKVRELKAGRQGQFIEGLLGYCKDFGFNSEVRWVAMKDFE